MASSASSSGPALASSRRLRRASSALSAEAVASSWETLTVRTVTEPFGEWRGRRSNASRAFRRSAYRTRNRALRQIARARLSVTRSSVQSNQTLTPLRIRGRKCAQPLPRRRRVALIHLIEDKFSCFRAGLWVGDGRSPSRPPPRDRFPRSPAYRLATPPRGAGRPAALQPNLPLRTNPVRSIFPRAA